MNYENLYFCVLLYKAIKYLSEGGHTKYQCKNKHKKSKQLIFTNSWYTHAQHLWRKKKGKNPIRNKSRKLTWTLFTNPFFFSLQSLKFSGRF